MKIDILRALVKATEDKQPVVLETNLVNGAQQLIGPSETMAEDLKAAVTKALRADKPLTTKDFQLLKS